MGGQTTGEDVNHHADERGLEVEIQDKVCVDVQQATSCSSFLSTSLTYCDPKLLLWREMSLK